MFKELFEKYGYVVEKFGKSFIADNGTFCIPYTEYGDSFPLISTVSFLSEDKDEIKREYSNSETEIGFKVFSDWMNNELNFTHFGGLGNHDHSLGEVENWLIRCSR